MEYRASSTVYKKFSNARSFNDKSAYDGVFAAPSKHGAPVFSARVEDYREIFGGSRVSSIPILDVPALSDKKHPVDVRSSKLEYSKIFGGFDELNFAISYEELLAESNKAKSCPREARTSAGRGSSAAENSSQHGKENNFSTREASSQPLDRMELEKINVSHQKVNRGNTNCAMETAHVALPRAAPENIESEVAKKPELPISGDSEQTFRSTNPTNCQNRTGWFRSDSSDKLFNGYEVDQGVQDPETPPKCNVLPKFGISDGFSGRTTGLRSEAFEHSENPCDVSSPPYFGEEVDVDPVAAASVAALRKAIDAAQERINIARVSMERRKGAGLQKHKKVRSSRNLNSEERRELRSSNNSSTCQEKMAGETYGKVDTSEQGFAESRKQSSSAECPATQTVMRENLNATETNYMEFLSTKVDCSEEEAEELEAVEQFYEPMSFDKDEAKELKREKEDNADENRWQGNNGIEETFENPGEYGDSFVQVKEAKEPEESGINLSVMKGILLSKLKSVLGVVEHEENKIKCGQNQLETEIKAEASMKHEKCVELLEELQVTKDHEKLAIREMGENNNMETQVEAHQWVVEEVRDICQREEEIETNTVQIEKDVEKILDESNENERNINWINDSHDGKEAEDMKVNGESKRIEELQINKQDDEMIAGLSFHLYNNENGQTSIGECAVYESIVKETPDNLNTKNKIELEDGLCEQDECDNISEDLEASNFIESMERVEVITDQPEHGDTDISTEVAMTSFEAVNNEPGAIIEEGDMEDRVPPKLFSTVEDALKRGELTIKMEDSDASHISIQNGIDFGMINMKLEEMQYDTPVNWSSIFCSLGNAEGFTPELRVIERNKKKIEVSLNEENYNDDSHEEMLHDENNIETGNPPSICEDEKKISVVMEETVTSIITGATVENHHATLKTEESETDYVLEKEVQLESNDNNTIAGSQFGMIEIDSEIIHEIKRSQSPRESEKSYEEIMREDGIVASDSSDKEKEYAVHLENLEEANSPGSSGRKENLANIEQEVSTSQKGIANENHQTTPTLDEIGINAEVQREAGVESEFNNETAAAHGLSQAEEGVEELPEMLTNQSILENEENRQAQLMEEEKVSHEKVEKEAEVIKERQRKIDEAKEKERERERLAVERAIREARERAFAEARERAAAEKASAGTRRRVMAEARERSGKISIEANKKPTTEAKLKAQRAAVEMATAEARERALEKAMSEKAISEARNLADKIVAEKLCGAAGDGKIKKSFSFSDSQPKGPSPSSNFRHANSFNLGGPESSEREVGSDGESVQRSKARLERHQRTVERVAKALAEKNIRDILAQREQEERNRLAEALDAEVKRWSSGKEGNLRALLSTLQYILGPDSGWQPVPLTDIITSAAVKKAYRRATLSVHPDKLQQRGASIQQKYICEKVFDLLKAAWNRFNVEER
ncbi:auxilin-like protein 1 isoform X2 [Momordica charantia]|uniref:Auxilin-like protein 1 isoform X2 n=1 Tax=Momordica charantia TaxID=3673 RepID=A0A6J1BSQ1_MOMCH|nr:auxilin-like protein 1 isoform X2 [Momordica charantia]